MKRGKQGKAPRLRSMERVRGRYSASATTKKADAPHSGGAQVWAERPLSAAAVAYAATDVQILKELFYAMRAVGVPDYLMDGVRKHSRRYESVFRDRATEVRRREEREFVMPEHPIISMDDLPLNHALRPTARVRWNKVVAQLRSMNFAATSTLCNDVLFVLQRNVLYTDEAFVVLRELADNYPYFTDSQRELIKNPPGLYDDALFFDKAGNLIPKK